MNKKENLRKLGQEYEKTAGQYLIKKGYRIVEYNYRTRYSEIDIIAKDGDIYVFCEVKYRKKNSMSSPFSAVHIRKQERISKAALHYLMVHHLSDVPCRFDVIGIEGETITHMENAFDYIGG